MGNPFNHQTNDHGYSAYFLHWHDFFVVYIDGILSMANRVQSVGLSCM